MGWDLFRKSSKEVVSKQSSLQPSKDDGGDDNSALGADPAVMKWIMDTIADFGLSPEDIIRAVKTMDYSKNIVKKEAPQYYILAFLDQLDGSGAEALADSKCMLVHSVLAHSKRGIASEGDEDDQRILSSYLKPGLGKFGVELDFSPHEDGTPFRMTARKEGKEHSADVLMDEGQEDRLPSIITSLNGLLGNFDLLYLKMYADVGDHYILLEKGQHETLKTKYGTVLDEIVNCQAV
jgi:hypothetical protein